MLICSSADDALARIGRALADGSRQRILLALLDGAASPSDLARQLGTSRSNVSNHLACLRGCGLVVADWRGRTARYELADPHLARALLELIDVVLAVDTGPTRSSDAVTSRRVTDSLPDPLPDSVSGQVRT